jgi:hypothetical protein
MPFARIASGQSASDFAPIRPKIIEHLARQRGPLQIVLVHQCLSQSAEVNAPNLRAQQLRNARNSIKIWIIFIGRVTMAQG